MCMSQKGPCYSPVFFTTELKLLRMEPILFMSTLSRAAAGAAMGGEMCVMMGCSVATNGALFAGIGAGTSGWRTGSVRSSTEERKYGSDNSEREGQCNGAAKCSSSTFGFCD